MITFMESFVKELEHESVGTRKMLALVPADKFDWKPHAKSMNLKDLATHLADLPTWITLAIEKDELDFATSPYNPQKCNGPEELVKYFDKSLEEAKRHLSSNTDSILEELWTLRNGDIVYMKLTRLETIRHSFCQMVHHRAQLGVYLRLLNIPIPGVYGPSADEQTM
ncbi:MAG TPA: DinB family protein [Flavobacteriales bacterium]|nr:DinB family protein [Flavobacteriales bacterium]